MKYRRRTFNLKRFRFLLGDETTRLKRHGIQAMGARLLARTAIPANPRHNKPVVLPASGTPCVGKSTSDWIPTVS